MEMSLNQQGENVQHSVLGKRLKTGLDFTQVFLEPFK